MAPATNKQPRLYLDDLVVGQTFSSDEYTLNAEQIIAFAREFDPQPFHTDPEVAKASFFRGHAASGWHVMAITMRLLVQSIPLADGIIGLGGDVSWPHPTRPGDRLHVDSDIVHITPSRSKPDRAVVQVRSQTINQDGQVVLEVVAKLMVLKKAA